MSVKMKISIFIHYYFISLMNFQLIKIFVVVLLKDIIFSYIGREYKLHSIKTLKKNLLL